MARVVGSMARVALLALSLALLSCGASAVDVSADAEAGAAPKAQAVALFSITITVDGKDHAIPLFEGDSPAAIARAFGAEHNVPVDGVNKIAQHVSAGCWLAGYSLPAALRPARCCCCPCLPLVHRQLLLPQLAPLELLMCPLAGASSPTRPLPVAPSC